MSFTGTPLIITAMFSELNPRILMSASPKPPPCLVTYTPGVVFRISGNSWFPNLVSIVSAFTVETATGVFLSIAKEKLVITISSKALSSPSITISPKS